MLHVEKGKDDFVAMARFKGVGLSTRDQVLKEARFIYMMCTMRETNEPN
jgi:hypothetical protein